MTQQTWEDLEKEKYLKWRNQCDASSFFFQNEKCKLTDSPCTENPDDCILWKFNRFQQAY